MHNLSKILSIFFFLFFLNIEVNANSLPKILKGLKLLQKIPETILHPYQYPRYARLLNHLNNNMDSPEKCNEINDKINEIEYRNSIFEELDTKDKESNNSNKDDKDPFFPIKCNWKDSCICEAKSKKRLSTIPNKNLLKYKELSKRTD